MTVKDPVRPVHYNEKKSKEDHKDSHKLVENVNGNDLEIAAETL